LRNTIGDPLVGGAQAFGSAPCSTILI